MTCYFLIPVFNEADNIPLLKTNLLSISTDTEVFFVFVDDNSSDDSVSLVKDLFSDMDFHIIEKQNNVGPGDSFNLGFEWILEHSKSEEDIIVTLEADNTSDLQILPDMLVVSMLGYELVLASIYAQGGGFYKTSLFRKAISFFANMMFRSIFDIKVLTLSSFYRVYHKSLVRRIQQQNDEIISERGFISMLEILIKSIRCNASIIEVPMTLKSDARKGKSKMKILTTSMCYLRFLFFTKK